MMQGELLLRQGVRIVRKLSSILMLVACLGTASAQPPKEGVIRIGVLTDLAGPLADWAGQGSVEAAALAVEDYEKSGGRYRVEILSADHQNKPDVATLVARKWIRDEGVSAIVDVANSSVALAVNEVIRDSKAALLASAATNVDLIGSACSPNTILWTTDSWALSNVAAKGLLDGGRRKWFFITIDTAGGLGLEKGAVAAVISNGGEVMGRVRFPFGTMDYASYLLQAQASGAEAIGLAAAGTDMANLLKQADEFGMSHGHQTLVGLAMFLTDVHSLGLNAAQGLQLASAYYWDLNDGTRAFAKRFAARMKGKYPTQMQAGAYASLLHYLKAADALGDLDGRTVVRKMKELPTDDLAFGKASIREDGRTMVDQYLFEVKAPAESHNEWDLYRLVKRIPSEQAYMSLADGGCQLMAGKQ